MDYFDISFMDDPRFAIKRPSRPRTWSAKARVFAITAVLVMVCGALMGMGYLP